MLETQEASAASVPALIHCTICLTDKSPNEFYPSGRGNETGQCKACVKERQRDKRRGGKKRAKPASFNPEQLMQAMAGPDPRLVLAEKLLGMQQRTIELLVGGK